jgi:hypothetical protein
VKSPTGEPASDLLRATGNTGLPRTAILNAAKVARKRKIEKRQAQEDKNNKGQQPVRELQPQVIQHRQQPPVPQVVQPGQHRTHTTTHVQSVAKNGRSQSHARSHFQPQHAQQQQAYCPPNSTSSSRYPCRFRWWKPIMLILSIIITSSSSIDRLQRTINNIRTNSSRVSGCSHRQHLDHIIHSNNIWHSSSSSSSVRIQHFDRPASRPLSHPLIVWLSALAPAPFPKNPWRRAQNGTFYVQKGRFMVLNNTIGANSIPTSACKALLSIR